MAIDTEDKRRSALLLPVFPVPDSNIGYGDRRHALWLYRQTVLSGPFAADEAQVYVQGQQEGQVYLAGSAEGQVYKPGQVEGQVQPT